MPGALKARAPAPARSRAEESRGGAAAGHRRAARDELCAKKMGVAPAELSNPDPRLIMLRKRQREEMEALRGILRKAELLAGKTAGDGRAAPRRGKDGRFLAAEARPAPAAAEADRATSAKRRKTMMPLVKIVKPKMSADEISNLATRVSSLSEDMPARILEFLKKECSGHEDANRGEIEIDIGSMRHPSLFELRKMLDEFAEEENRRRQEEVKSKNASRPTSRSSSGQHEDGEIVEEEDRDVTMDTCSLASSVADKILCSKQEILEDGEIAEAEEGDVMCSDAAPVATEKFAESGNSPSSSSSSSSGSSGSSSNSGCSTGGSCSDSSDSDSSDSDSDDESVTNSPAPAVLPKTGNSPMAVDLCPSPCLTEQVPRSSPRRSSSSLPEDGEIEEECPPAPEKFAGAVTSPRNSYSSGSADDGSVSTIPAPAALPEPSVQQPAARDRKLPLSQAEYRAMIAKALQKQRRRQNPERQRAYEELEEKERKAKPISDWIQPMQLSQLGITPVEYAVTSERRVPGRGSPVQRLLGLFLKAE